MPERSLIVRQLNRKVGSIDDRALTQITNLSVAQLEDLGESLFDFDSIVGYLNRSKRSYSAPEDQPQKSPD